MDEQEFRRLLELFPVVRPRDYHDSSVQKAENKGSKREKKKDPGGIFPARAELDSSRQSTSRSASNKALIDWQDAWNDGERNEMESQESDLHDKFWQKLKLAAESKVGAAEADKFCKAFQQVHKKLVYEGLSFDAAQMFLNS